MRRLCLSLLLLSALPSPLAWADAPPARKTIRQIQRMRPDAAATLALATIEGGQATGSVPTLALLLADALEGDGLNLAARPWFEAAADGGGEEVRVEALAGLSRYAEATGDQAPLEARLGLPRPAGLSEEVVAHLDFLQARALFAQGDDSGARRAFSDVGSTFRPRARFYVGVIASRQGKLQSAVAGFQEVYQDMEQPGADLRGFAHLQDLALLNVGRIYYGLQRYETALQFYGLVDAKGGMRAQADLEMAWALFMLEDLDRALPASLAAAQSVEDYLPEASVLHALILFEQGVPDEELRASLEKLATRFESDSKALRELARTPKEDQAELFRRCFAREKRETPPMSEELLARIGRDAEVQVARTLLAAADEELASVREHSDDWREGVGRRARRTLDGDIERARQLGGAAVADLAGRIADELDQQRVQADLIRFELGEAERVRLDQGPPEPKGKGAHGG